MDSEIDRLTTLVDNLAYENLAQHEQIAELKSYVAMLRVTLTKTYFVYDGNGESHTCIDGQDIDEAFREVPKQSLNKIKAEAIKEALDVLHQHSRDGDVVGYVDLLDYAERLTNGNK